jgi:hypothetical protein
MAEASLPARGHCCERGSAQQPSVRAGMRGNQGTPDRAGGDSRKGV